MRNALMVVLAVLLVCGAGCGTVTYHKFYGTDTSGVWDSIKPGPYPGVRTDVQGARTDLKDITDPPWKVLLLPIGIPLELVDVILCGIADTARLPWDIEEAKTSSSPNQSLERTVVPLRGQR